MATMARMRNAFMMNASLMNLGGGIHFVSMGTSRVVPASKTHASTLIFERRSGNRRLTTVSVLLQNRFYGAPRHRMVAVARRGEDVARQRARRLRPAERGVD